MTTRCKVEKWEADSGEVLDVQTCIRTPAFMFSLLSSLVSDNCHSHWAKRHVMAPARFRRDGENLPHKFAMVAAVEFRVLFAYIIYMPEDEKQRGALLIAACLIAAMRLRGEPIQPSPKLKATISDSVQLAVMVRRELQPHGSLPKN